MCLGVFLQCLAFASLFVQLLTHDQHSKPFCTQRRWFY